MRPNARLPDTDDTSVCQSPRIRKLRLKSMSRTRFNPTVILVAHTDRFSARADVSAGTSRRSKCRDEDHDDGG